MARRLLLENQKKVPDLRARVMRRNKEIAAIFEKHGVTVEYNKDEDYLYITIGEPRPGMALSMGEAVAIVDPDTLELLAIDVPFYMEKLGAGDLKGAWRNFARWADHGTAYVPTKQEVAEASEQLTKDLALNLL